MIIFQRKKCDKRQNIMKVHKYGSLHYTNSIDITIK